MTLPTGPIQIEHEKIASIEFLGAVGDPRDAQTEIYVTLHSGAIYSFTVYTPTYLARVMDENGWLSFVDVDMLIVRVVSPESVLHALEQCLAMGIARFGLLVEPKKGRR